MCIPNAYCEGAGACQADRQATDAELVLLLKHTPVFVRASELTHVMSLPLGVWSLGAGGAVVLCAPHHG